MNRFFCSRQINSNQSRFIYKDGAANPESAAQAEEMENIFSEPKGPETQHYEERRAAADVAAFNKGSLIDRVEANNAIDETGEPKLYLETFNKSPKLDEVYSTLRTGIEAGGSVYSHYNFSEWLTKPRVAARIFESFDGTNFMPSGKGRISL